jgi:hypothetical protein
MLTGCSCFKYLDVFLSYIPVLFWNSYHYYNMKLNHQKMNLMNDHRSSKRSNLNMTIFGSPFFHTAHHFPSAFHLTVYNQNIADKPGKPQSEKENTIQWQKVEDTQRVNQKARKNIQYNGQQLMIRPLYCMFFLALWFTRWVSPTVGHCTVCSFSIRGLPVGYLQLLAIVLYVLSRFMVYPLGIINCWPLYCMFFLAL